VLATVLVGIAAGISVPLIATNDRSSSLSTPNVTSIRSGGPNESARGQAAGEAAGARPGPGTGGPNETARGQAVHSAAGGSFAPGPGGPNEALRGNVVSSATK
jgi:hypothetical protein